MGGLGRRQIIEFKLVAKGDNQKSLRVACRSAGFKHSTVCAVSSSAGRPGGDDCSRPR